MPRLHVLLAVSLTAVIGSAQPTHDPVSIARKALTLLLDEKYAELRSMFTQKMLDAVSEDTLRNQVGPHIKSFGKLEKIGDATVQKIQGMDVVFFSCNFTVKNFNFQFTVDQAGKIAGMLSRPAEAPKSSDKTGPSSWTKPPSAASRIHA